MQLGQVPLVLTSPFQLQMTGARQTASTRRHIHDVMYGSFTLTLPESALRPNEHPRIVLWDTKSKTIRGISCVHAVPANKTGASPESGLILFDELKDTDGVLLPSVWTYWKWSVETGVQGEALGTMKISNVSFVQPDETAFTPPSNAREVPVAKSQ
jgi:hypothetical protein